jgi:hypothetical protein
MVDKPDYGPRHRYEGADGDGGDDQGGDHEA